MGPAHYEEAHIPRKGLKMWHRVSSRTEDQDKDFQQWLMEGHTLHVTHYVPTHLFHIPGSKRFTQVSRIHEIHGNDGLSLSGPGRDSSLQIYNPNLVYTEVNEESISKKGSKRVERCLELGKASSVEDESQEVPLNHQKYLEDISKQEEIVMLVGWKGKGSLGGGG
ncbi:hypothetical protein D8674_035348 [Pyrus ussuriensis x Pyrus communis]|uniref:Uncharacterized protein n=1 Tax=Pyrus ussuriensis x Pyrus communis TaxID=2448454 RepID=A0A5N5GHL2_9ROSA|nr:hypothetical protein D8674_035348 [Pyrus ussuriensis x Pyrus communis]